MHINVIAIISYKGSTKFLTAAFKVEFYFFIFFTADVTLVTIPLPKEVFLSSPDSQKVHPQKHVPE